MIRLDASSNRLAYGVSPAARWRWTARPRTPGMSKRDTLLNWLDRAAARAHHADRLRDCVALFSALLALVALHQALRAAIAAPEVLAALVPFLVFAAAG